MIQRLILEDETTTYDVLIDLVKPSSGLITSPQREEDDDDEVVRDVPRGGVPRITPEMRVKLADVHHTIQGYTQYAIGAFKNLAIAEVEEITLSFNLKISAEGGLPMIASGKTESDFAIEVKCKFPKTDGAA